MEIPIRIDKRNYFKLILNILQPLIKATPREKDVLICLMMIEYSNPQLTPEKLLTKELRGIVSNTLDISSSSLNNIICDLRKKELLIGNKVNPNLSKFYPNQDNIEVTYKIEING